MHPLLERLAATDRPSQLDPGFAVEIGELARRDYTAADVKALLDRGAHEGLCSDFVMQVLNAVWDHAKGFEVVRLSAG